MEIATALTDNERTMPIAPVHMIVPARDRTESAKYVVNITVDFKPIVRG